MPGSGDAYVSHDQQLFQLFKELFVNFGKGMQHPLIWN